MPLAADQFYLEVGRRIQGLRATKGLTQAALGRLLNPPVTRASIANLESGRQGLLLHTFIQITKILECSLSDLIPPTTTARVDIALESQVARELGKAKVPDEARRRISQQFMLPAKKNKL
ncbi:MAG: helix-turn-helix domain-containing protein [Luteitalea sp.]|nr:helix-turn-helix domain-containing protein [Luteitalea sp.]